MFEAKYVCSSFYILFMSFCVVAFINLQQGLIFIMNEFCQCTYVYKSPIQQVCSFIYPKAALYCALVINYNIISQNFLLVEGVLVVLGIIGSVIYDFVARQLPLL